MPELTFRSPGTSVTETDLSGPTSIEPSGIPAGVISPTQKGPAFVPMIQATPQDFRVRFGEPVENLKLGALSAFEWLRTQQSHLQLRVLGIGDGLQRTSVGALNAGKVTSAGFVVGDQQPQLSLNGALGVNSYANALSLNATGSAGRTHILGCFMSQSAGSTFMSDAGLAAGGSATPIVRGVILAASGVFPTLSSSFGDSSEPSKTAAASFAADTIRGSFTGSLKLSGGLQEFVLLLNGTKAADPSYPNVITASFDTSATNYFGDILNTDPLKLEQAGYVLYTSYDVNNAIAIPTGSGIVEAASGSAVLGAGFENIAFLITGSQARNSGSATAPNFENFEDRFQAPSTSWFISQDFGGRTQNLFKVHALSDGEFSNDTIKISIENISPSNSVANPYGTFDLLVRAFGDTDINKIVFEQWRGLSLDPSSPKYIARVIGNSKTFFNFDTGVNTQKLQTIGEFPVNSRHIRIEVDPSVDSAEIPNGSLPVGFRGNRHLMTSGSAPLPGISHSGYFTKTNVLFDTVQMPIPMRMSLSKGSGSTKTAEKSLYWGVQFEQVISATEPNASALPNTSLGSFTKYFPSFQLEWANTVVRDNPGTPETTANGIIDADKFCNNMFSLERVKIGYNTTTGLANLNTLKNWVYIRGGGIATDSVAATRALTVADLLDPSVRSVAKFTAFLEGGFDGVRPFNVDTKFLTNNATVEELNNVSRGFASGPTILAYQKAIDIIKDTSEVDIQILTTPGIRNRYITDSAIMAVENSRFDCFYIMDIEERDMTNALVIDPSQDTSVKFTANDFRSRSVSSDFAAAYFPDVIIRDDLNRTVERVPPSVVALGALGKNDAVGHPWFAPAGYTRGSLGSVEQTALALSRANLDDLYSVNINPIATFAGQGPTVWGQKTCKISQSALERINVRRLLLDIRRSVKKVSNRIMFEPLLDDTIANLSRLVNPILKRVQDQGGVDNFKVMIDTSTTTQADIDNKTIKGKIFLIPTRSTEFVSLSLVLTNRGNFVSG